MKEAERPLGDVTGRADLESSPGRRRRRGRGGSGLDEYKKAFERRERKIKKVKRYTYESASRFLMKAISVLDENGAKRGGGGGGGGGAGERKTSSRTLESTKREPRFDGRGSRSTVGE